MTKREINSKRNFIVSLNYAFKYGSCKYWQMTKARKEFGAIADQKIKSLGLFY
jgi:hypothetical protein